MHLPRPFARAVALTFAAVAFAACGGDSTSPLDLDPQEFEDVASTVAFEVEGSVMQLTIDGTYPEMGTPAFALGSRTAERILGPAAHSVAPVRQMLDENCGVPSQEPPVDSDEDGVPDNFWITFALPACHLVQENGTLDITGVFRVSDPMPGTAGMHLNFSLDDFRVGISGEEFAGSVLRDGAASVSATASGLSQTQEWNETVRFDGFPIISAAIDWTATFAAAQGQSIVEGEPLPDGAYTPGGIFVYRQGNQQSAFAVTTTEALQYSAECAAGVFEGLADSPFTAGQFRVAFSGQQGAGFVQITYSDCGFPLVQFMGVQ